nr:MAG TPA: hypothetical protein [Caudoviricetes sp.]
MKRGHQLASTGHQLADYRTSASYSLNSRPQRRLFFYLSSNPDLEKGQVNE